MRHIYSNKIFSPMVLLSSLCLLFSACEMDNGDDAYISELGAVKREYIVPVAAGSIEMKVLSNTDYEASIINNVGWARLEESKLSGDSQVKVIYEENDKFPRMLGVSIFAASTNRHDTIYLKQEGAYLPEIKFTQTSMPILSEAGEYQVGINTNLEFKDINIQLMYFGDDEKDWIAEDFSIKDGQFILKAKQNLSETKTRTVKISTSYVDEWKQKTVSDLYVLQARVDNLFGTAIDLEQLRTDPSWIGKLPNGFIMEGFVISDKGNANVADTPNTTNTITDYSANDKTAYIQSLDGRYGFRILTSSIEDNIFERYSKVQVILDGSTLSVDHAPDRFTISGITADKVVSAIPGTASVLPAKERYMGNLADNDIYTYVTLKDCEFPVRKGSLMPINEGYAHTFNAHRVNKYPLLVRDIQGNSMYMLTNSKCEYRRDGTQLPYGSGKLSGVVVHETYTRFEYEDTGNEDTFGNIGTYQIRHISRDDIKMEKSINNSFSALLTEFRYTKINGAELQSTTGVPSVMRHLPTKDATNTKVIGASGDFSYLGPVGADNKGNKNGNGIDDPDYSMSSIDTNSDGKGAVNASDNSGWLFRSKKWWNYESDYGEGFVIETSTSGISTNQLSLQISQWNSNIGAPRFWEIHWSKDMSDDSWESLAKYSVPDVVDWNNTQLHQTAGSKYMNFPLPLTMLGKEKVFIRLRPAKDLASDGRAYASVRIVGDKNTSFNYVAIRYNK